MGKLNHSYKGHSDFWDFPDVNIGNYIPLHTCTWMLHYYIVESLFGRYDVIHLGKYEPPTSYSGAVRNDQGSSGTKWIVPIQAHVGSHF